MGCYVGVCMSYWGVKRFYKDVNGVVDWLSRKCYKGVHRTGLNTKVLAWALAYCVMCITT